MLTVTRRHQQPITSRTGRLPIKIYDVPLVLGSLYPYDPSWEGSCAFSFKGLLDDVAIWRKTLGAADVTVLWNNGAGQTASAVK